MSRLKDRYQNDVIAGLRKEFGYTNIMAVPKITKVVVNMGLGEATSMILAFDVASPRPMLTTTLVILGTAMMFV